MKLTDLFTQLGDRSVTIIGSAGSGKSSLLFLIMQVLSKIGEGFSFIDPHGQTARDTAQWMSNPANGRDARTVHVLDCAGPLVFGINPFQTFDDTWDACHRAALAFASIVEDHYGQNAEQTPRLARLMYVAGMIIARKRLTLLELAELFTLGAHELRRSLIEDFDNRMPRAQLEDLIVLAQRHPRDFANLTESALNRTTRWASNKPLARTFGSSRSIDPRQIMRDRACVLFDLSSLPHEDAAFLGKCITSLYQRAARTREPNVEPFHRLICDEAADMLASTTSRVLDATRKFHLTGIWCLQRTLQAKDKERGDSIFEALMVNTPIKFIFNTPEPDAAEYLARVLFTGWLDLQKWKDKSTRPVAVGNQKVILHNRSHARHRAEHHGSAVVDMTSHGSVSAHSSATIAAWGTGSSSGDNASVSLAPPDPLFNPPATLSESLGHNTGRSSSMSAARSAAHSTAHQKTRARGITTTHARAQGISLSEGESEAYITRYEDFPTQMWSLPELLHSAAGEIMNLPRRELFVKVGSECPWRTRTPDLTPAYRSEVFKALMLPRFLRNAAARSPYLVPAEVVDREIAARFDALARKPEVPEPDFAAPQPTPTVLDDAHTYAEGFRRRSADRRKAKPKSSKPFRVIEGGADGGDNKP